MSEKRSGFPNDLVVILLFVHYILVVNFKTSLILRVGYKAPPPLLRQAVLGVMLF